VIAEPALPAEEPSPRVSAAGPFGEARNAGQIYLALTPWEKAGPTRLGTPQLYALTPAGPRRVDGWPTDLRPPGKYLPAGKGNATFLMGKYFPEVRVMAEKIESTEAAQALAQIRDRRQQVIDATMIPAWYWGLVGGLNVLLTVAVESRRPTFVAVGAVVFAVGLLAGTGWVVRRAIRVKVRTDLLGVRALKLILGFVAVTVAAALSVAFSLQEAGVAYPATWGELAAAVCLVIGGPLLMRALRRTMLDHGTESGR